MNEYNYREHVKDDIKQCIEDNADYFGWNPDDMTKEDLYESVYDFAWIDDLVTGNASGSYTFSRYDAETYLNHNMDLLSKACQEFGCEPKLDDPEWCDVTIRCYVLPQCLSEVLDEVF